MKKTVGKAKPMAEAEDTMVDLGEDEKAKGDLGEEAEAKMDLSEDYTNEATASSMPSPAEQVHFRWLVGY